MVNPLVLVLLLSSMASLELGHEASARRIFARLLVQGHYGGSHIEQAAFLLRDERGRLVAVDWPATGETDSAAWAGPLPAGVVAIAHTHPNWLPRPSRIDRATARRTRVPVYVITRTEIWKTDGETPATVATGDWSGGDAGTSGGGAEELQEAEPGLSDGSIPRREA